jgi:hypothetical protein
MYDSLAILASVPEIRKSLFTPTVHKFNGVEHQVCGLSADETGLSSEQQSECVEFLDHAYESGMCTYCLETQTLCNESVH